MGILLRAAAEAGCLLSVAADTCACSAKGVCRRGDETARKTRSHPARCCCFRTETSPTGRLSARYRACPSGLTALGLGLASLCSTLFDSANASPNVFKSSHACGEGVVFEG
jgi:hypothetical protein